MRAVSIIAAILLGAANLGAEHSDDAIAANWHQWRGPLASGVAPVGDPPIEWGEEKNVRWKVELPGAGSATPIVWNEHIFILAAVETERVATEEEIAALREANEGQMTEPPSRYWRFVVLDVDRATGQVRWERTACEALPHEGIQPTNTYASASPITDGRFVYASFGSRGIYCYDFAGGLVWSRDLGDMRTRHGWGEGASPALCQELQTLFVNWDQEGQSYLFALDSRTGDVRWQVERDEPTSWATPLVVDHGEATQVVVPATSRICSYDASSGDLLWECEGLTTNVIASPVATEDTVICMGWYGDAAVKAISLDARGDVTGGEHVRWQYDVLAPYCPSPLVYENDLFITRANTGVFAVLDAKTGETKIGPSRLPAIDGELYASPVAAAGRIYYLGRDGTAIILGHGGELELLSVNRLDDSFDASPAMVGRQIFLRGRRYLYCLEASP
jgi:outer membrane protein assembly factor BamB